MLSKKIQAKLIELREDNTSGANELINKALNIVKYQIELLSDKSEDFQDKILELTKEILKSRPSMAPLINMMGYLLQNLEVITKKDILIRIQQFVLDKFDMEKTLERNFTDFILENIKDLNKIMLISYSSTIIRLLNTLKDLKDCDIELFIMESRPLFEGQKTAEILSSNFQTHLFVDAAIGKIMDEMNLVLVGIDSILTDGSIINKIGTFPLAIVANESGIEVYAVGESLKYNLNSHFGLKVEIEEKPSDQVFKPENSEKHIIVHNYYFEITPPKYITGIISDLGVLKPQTFVKKAKKILPIDWFQKFLNNND
jgi:translation initiation factor eIF-2B subunit delta